MDQWIYDALGALGAAVTGGGLVWAVTPRKVDPPALTGVPRDEGLIGGEFTVKRDFEIPHLGHYWARHTYRLTRHNKAAVDAAIGRGDAEMVK